ncbi:Mpv17-like protein 2 [Strongyloides ratti]|uniref:Mpv17-like protein 2 n=1 Tax=Strongyloides ratti TaxID=34506 RepID=A0A090MVM8_STRRB|nr:Mpv17-like protein 2 [Strongyloides ratti]CEF63003.1 Mpv17-like protein 2 [Strongyloides ratti]
MKIKKRSLKVDFTPFHVFTNNIYSTKYIYLSNVLTTSGFFIIGDVLSQYITRNINEEFKLDYSRILRLSFVGGNIGLMTTVWYKFLDGFVRHPNRIIRNFVKIKADFCISPIFSSFCIITPNLLEGKTFESSVKEYTLQWKHILKTDLCIWPPFQFFNFFLLDPKFRVLYVATVDIIYSCCMSYFANKNNPSKIC